MLNRNSVFQPKLSTLKCHWIQWETLKHMLKVPGKHFEGIQSYCLLGFTLEWIMQDHPFTLITSTILLLSAFHPAVKGKVGCKSNKQTVSVVRHHFPRILILFQFTCIWTRVQVQGDRKISRIKFYICRGKDGSSSAEYNQNSYTVWPELRETWVQIPTHTWNSLDILGLCIFSKPNSSDSSDKGIKWRTTYTAMSHLKLGIKMN